MISQHVLNIAMWLAGGTTSLIFVLLGMVYRGVQERHGELKKQVEDLEKELDSMRQNCLGALNREAVKRLEKMVDAIDNRVDRLTEGRRQP